jgi:RNA polymerase sigma factor (sigma-70 family)
VIGSDAVTDWERHEVRRLVPLFPYGDRRFRSFFVAEPDSNRPKHFARPLNFLRRKGRSREDAEDLIQEAMLRLHVYTKSQVVMNEEAFLRRAVQNLAIDHYRRNRLVVGQEVQIEAVDRQQPLIAPDPTPDQVLDSQQCLGHLTAILDAVSRRTREVYLANRSGYTRAEIANDLGIAETTVKRHITCAHLIIQQHIGSDSRSDNSKSASNLFETL